MRNLSLITHPVFQSYDINAGEYRKTVRVDEVVTALARAFQSNVSFCRLAYELICQKGIEEAELLLNGSEMRVLNDLYEFARGCEIPQSGPWGQETRVFTYVNLNTGASVQWIDFRG